MIFLHSIFLYLFMNNFNRALDFYTIVLIKSAKFGDVDPLKSMRSAHNISRNIINQMINKIENDSYVKSSIAEVEKLSDSIIERLPKLLKSTFKDLTVSDEDIKNNISGRFMFSLLENPKQDLIKNIKQLATIECLSRISSKLHRQIRLLNNDNDLYRGVHDDLLNPYEYQLKYFDEHMRKSIRIVINEIDNVILDIMSQNNITEEYLGLNGRTSTFNDTLNIFIKEIENITLELTGKNKSFEGILEGMFNAPIRNLDNSIKLLGNKLANQFIDKLKFAQEKYVKTPNNIDED